MWPHCCEGRACVLRPGFRGAAPDRRATQREDTALRPHYCEGCTKGEEFGPSFAWMGNLAALKVKLREIYCDGDGDMVVGAVIAPEVIVHRTAADMHIDYDAALLIVQSLKARQYGDLVSRTKLFIKDAQQLYIAPNS